MNARTARKNRPLYVNDDGAISYRSLRRGWVDTENVKGFVVTLGHNSQGYFVHVDGKNRKIFSTLAPARTAYNSTVKTLAGL